MKKIIKILICFAIIVIGSILFRTTVFSANGNVSNLHNLTLLTSNVSDNPAMTILTPGQGSNKTAFSNYNGTFAYDANSLIEVIRSHANADVYVAEMSASNENDSTSFKDFSLYLCEQGSQISGTNYYNYVLTYVDKICDYTKHSVIIFDQYFSNDYHNIVYSELESLIDSVSYDYKIRTGKIPKVNLIGHSRGGLINLLYATNHPYNVGSLISIGTPYSGSAFSRITKLIDAIGLSGAVNCNSGQDILNPTKQQELRNNWNTMLNNNPNVNINAIAIGSCTSSNYLAELFSGGYVNDELYSLLGIDSSNAKFLEKVKFFLCSLAANGITQYIENHPDVVKGIFKVIDFGLDVANFFSDDTTDEEREKIKIILNNCYLDYGSLVLYDDLFIDYQSQTAVGYNGFDVMKKIFFSDNTNYTKVSQVNVPIPHNLEARDEEIISFIMSKLSYGSILTNMGNITADVVKSVSNRTNAVKYSFTPTISTLYKLNCSNNNLSIIIHDTNTNTVNEYNSNELVKLLVNTNYNIYIHNNGTNYNNNFSISFPELDDFLNTNYLISPYENIYLKVQNTSSNIAKIKTNNNNVKLEVLNTSYQSISDYSETVTHRYASNVKYYLKVRNTSSVNQEFNLTQESLDVIIYNNSLSTTINSYYNYYKFVAPSTNTFIFDLVTSSSSNFSPNVEMYSNNFDLLTNMDTVNVKNKCLYSVFLTQGQTIYIAIKNMVNYNKDITIIADVSNYYWTVDGVIDDDRMVNMNRSGTDTIRVAYYCNGYQLEGSVKFLNGSEQYFINTPYVNGYEYDINLKNNADLNLNGTTYLSFLYEAYEGEVAFVTQEFYISVDPYVNIDLSDTTDCYDYSVIIEVDDMSVLSNESLSVTLSMKNRNNTSTMQTFTADNFYHAEFIPISTHYKVGDLEISIYSITYTKNSYSKTYYVSSDLDLFNIETSSITKKGLIQNGYGTSDSPYLITSYRELNNIREMSVFDSYYESYYISGYYKLANNIICTGTWQPIQTCFKGTFEGNYKTISNISMIISSLNNDYGLFKSVDNATFNNLYISNINLISGSNSSNVSIGGICGFATYSNFNGCTISSGNMGQYYNNYKSYIGGLVGFSNYSKFTNCTAGESLNQLKLYSYGTIGGIVGHAVGGSFSNCINRANLYYYWDGSNNRYTGGIIGRAISSTTINSCTNYGLIKFAGETSDSKELAPYMGQVIGYKASTVTLSNCSCQGSYNYENLKKVGGFLGIGRTDQARYASIGECGYSE